MLPSLGVLLSSPAMHTALSLFLLLLSFALSANAQGAFHGSGGDDIQPDTPTFKLTVSPDSSLNSTCFVDPRGSYTSSSASGDVWIWSQRQLKVQWGWPFTNAQGAQTFINFYFQCSHNVSIRWNSDPISASLVLYQNTIPNLAPNTTCILLGELAQVAPGLQLSNLSSPALHIAYPNDYCPPPPPPFSLPLWATLTIIGSVVVLALGTSVIIYVRQKRRKYDLERGKQWVFGPHSPESVRERKRQRNVFRRALRTIQPSSKPSDDSTTTIQTYSQPHQTTNPQQRQILIEGAPPHGTGGSSKWIAPEECGREFVVVIAHQAQDETELDVQRGDVVSTLQYFEDGWVQVKLKRRPPPAQPLQPSQGPNQPDLFKERRKFTFSLGDALKFLRPKPKVQDTGLVPYHCLMLRGLPSAAFKKPKKPKKKPTASPPPVVGVVYDVPIPSKPKPHPDDSIPDSACQIDTTSSSAGGSDSSRRISVEA
ncbi:uncharacterized protein BJ171DRAFT_193738 [Polychytrium aggregatum]|uniref:uncharacterized protein n=1 Tax=Polychytrium aggregatum TaxID=110093 RepID=UPI0022FE9F41|nr:uncharacterized protein BJ171DRAFT_193738 [Polychytrium aggregatum]KAI9201987.1 hypothetical protein BJ171DRAFT_193738 [Polychytrium aggregatum]